MSATNYHLDILGIDVHVVLDTIVTYDIAKAFFDRWRNGMFACVHMSDLRVSKSLGKFLPCLVRDVVGFSEMIREACHVSGSVVTVRRTKGPNRDNTTCQC